MGTKFCQVLFRKIIIIYTRTSVVNLYYQTIIFQGQIFYDITIDEKGFSVKTYIEKSHSNLHDDYRYHSSTKL